MSQFFYAEIVLASLFIVFMLFTKGKNDEIANVSLPAEEYIKHYSKQLEKQAQFLKGAKYWYVMPFMFGIVGRTLEQIYYAWKADEPLLSKLSYLVVCLIVGGVCIYWNEASAKKLKKIADDFILINQ